MLSRQQLEIALLFLAPLITLVNGIAIDLYTPSLPAIAQLFSISISLSKFTVSISMIGFGIGVAIFGGLSDNLGRRPLILIGLTLFLLASLTGMCAQDITVLLAARFFQGMGVAMAAMLARAALLDVFTGKRLQAAMLYTTIAWGIGPVIAPAIGGYLEQYYSWRANFLFYAIFSAVILLISLFFLTETLKASPQKKAYKWRTRYKAVLMHQQFQRYALLCVLCFTGFVSYGIVGPFLIQTQLGHSPIAFGRSALLIGAAYFIGTLISRILLSRISMPQLLKLGNSLMLVGTLAMLISSQRAHFDTAAIVGPYTIMTIGIGLSFPSAITLCLAPFREHAGTAACLHGGVVMTFGCLTTGLISLIPTHSLMPLTIIFGMIASLSALIVYLPQNHFSAALGPQSHSEQKAPT